MVFEALRKSFSRRDYGLFWTLHLHKPNVIGISWWKSFGAFEFFYARILASSTWTELYISIIVSSIAVFFSILPRLFADTTLKYVKSYHNLQGHLVCLYTCWPRCYMHWSFNHTWKGRKIKYINLHRSCHIPYCWLLLIYSSWRVLFSWSMINIYIICLLLLG
jgi:hypothetical protein